MLLSLFVTHLSSSQSPPANSRVFDSLTYLQTKHNTLSPLLSLHSSARPFPTLLVLSLPQNFVIPQHFPNEPTLHPKKRDYWVR